MRTYVKNKIKWEGDRENINKLINLRLLPLILTLFSIFKMKFKLIFKYLLNYEIEFHKSRAFSPATGF
jgi:hypothetical protein